MADREGGDFFRGLLTSFALVLGLILTGQLVFTFLVAPHLMISHVTLRSDAPLSKEALLQQAGLNEGLYFFSVEAETVRQSLMKHPEIRSARVEKIFPDGLLLEVRGRQPLALSLVEREKGSYPVAFDEEGVIFRMGREIRDWDRPVLSGIRYEKAALGLKLPAALKPLLEDLEILEREAPALYGLISEVKVERRGKRDYELLLCLTGYPLKIRLGNRLDAPLMRQALLIMDMMEDKGLSQSIDEVDFRTGEVVYAVRGEEW